MLSYSFFEVFELGDATVTLTASDPNWLVFDQPEKEVPEILSLKVETQKPLPGGPIQEGFFVTKVDYLLFETIDSTEQQSLLSHEFDFNEEDYWVTPSVCESISEKQPPLWIGGRYQMSVERLQMDSNELQKSNRTKILVDKQDGLKGYINEGKIQIYEEKFKILFEFENEFSCKPYYQKPLETDNDLFKLLDEISENPHNYREVGIQVVRNIRTNVYRKREEFEDKTVLKVATLYLQESKSEKNSEGLTHDPVQIKFEEFKRPDSTENYQLTGSILYNIFDFDSFKNDDELVKMFNLEECVDHSSVAALSLVAKIGISFFSNQRARS